MGREEENSRPALPPPALPGFLPSLEPSSYRSAETHPPQPRQGHHQTIPTPCCSPPSCRPPLHCSRQHRPPPLPGSQEATLPVDRPLLRRFLKAPLVQETSKDTSRKYCLFKTLILLSFHFLDLISFSISFLINIAMFSLFPSSSSPYTLTFHASEKPELRSHSRGLLSPGTIFSWTNRKI